MAPLNLVIAFEREMPCGVTARWSYRPNDAQRAGHRLPLGGAVAAVRPTAHLATAPRPPADRQRQGVDDKDFPVSEDRRTSSTRQRAMAFIDGR
jgi:hypothetical protein